MMTSRPQPAVSGKGFSSSQPRTTRQAGRSWRQRGHVNCSRHSGSRNGSHASASTSGTAVVEPQAQPQQKAEEAALPAPSSPFHTGSMDITTAGATSAMTSQPLLQEKQLVLVRHGLTTWNEQSRIQGASEESQLTAFGEAQAVRVREALKRMHFDSAFASPINRARRTAELVWAGRQQPLTFLDSLKEADLGWLQGMRNAEAAEQHEEIYRTWREQPEYCCIDGRFPVVEVFAEARQAWKAMLEAPGGSHLVITHKSIMRALVCVALGLPVSSFRAVDINNGGICVFRVNKRGEPMLQHMNMTAHMHADGVHY